MEPPSRETVVSKPGRRFSLGSSSTLCMFCFVLFFTSCFVFVKCTNPLKLKTSHINVYICFIGDGISTG